ncbi:MAG: LegC family aminotransferase [Pseudolysinimonas sp.]
MPTSMKIDAAQLVAAVREVVGDAPQIGLHIPHIGEAEHRYVTECLDSTFVSSVGPFVTRFEDEIAAFTGAARAIAVSNGTVALQVALTLAGVQPGDEVLVPALSFIATANAVSHAGAIPHFVDSDASTLGLDVAALRMVLEKLERRDGALVNTITGRRVSAIVPMHTFGHPVAIIDMVALGDEFGIPVVEDAAESLGSFVGDRHTGRFGRLGILSFNGNKIVTSGGGGMILTDDDELGARAKHLTTTAKVPHAWAFEHDEIGWNFRLPNLNAALGVAQLTHLEGFIAAKRALAERYRAVMADVPGVTFLAEPDGTTSNYWLCSVRIDGDRAERDRMLEALNADGLQARPFWGLLNEQAPYRPAPHGDLSTATALEASVISLPSSPALGGWRE